MKKPFLFTIFILLLQFGYPYSWESYGPSGIKATNTYFVGNANLDMLIMSDSGLFIVSNPQTWVYLDYHAKDAVHLDFENVLFVAGDNSSADGVYKLNIQTHQVEVIENILNPNFIEYYEPISTYYIGYDLGLLKSADGLNWEEIPEFNGMICSGMVSWNSGHILVNIIADLSHLFLSDDNGQTWTESTGSPGWITDMATCEDGKVYGVFPDNSYSSGLWSSADYGDTWDIEFYTTNLNTVKATNPYGVNILVGWTNSNTDYDGIAIYDSSVPLPGLIFLNENLPNTNINKIDFVGLLDVGILFACTDTGVFYCPDYFVGMPEPGSTHIFIEISPNPAREKTTITIENPDHLDLNPVYIMNSAGKIEDQIMISPGFSGKTKWNTGDLPAGVYYLVARTKNETITEKFILL
jgi:hypothetical protein